MNSELGIYLAGLVASVGLWLLGARLFLSVQASAIDSLPDSWRSHPRLRDAYDAAIEAGPLDVLTERRTLALWFTGVAVFSLLLSMLDVLLAIVLAVSAAYAAISTGAEVEPARRVRSELLESGEIDPVPTNRRLGRIYWLSLFAANLGFILAPVLAGYGLGGLIT